MDINTLNTNIGLYNLLKVLLCAYLQATSFFFPSLLQEAALQRFEKGHQTIEFLTSIYNDKS